MPKVVLSGPDGKIEAVYHHSPEKDTPIAICLHPNPLQGGSMNNKVTHALYQSFVEMGYPTVKFNFRGVGLSEGVYSDGVGELADTMFVSDWMQSFNGVSRPIIVAGYSFGSWIGMQLLMRRPEISGFISVNPPANIYDFSFLAPCPVPGIVFAAENDTVCPKESVDKLVEKLNSQKGVAVDYKVVEDCDHVYTNKLDVLKGLVKSYILNKSELVKAV